MNWQQHNEARQRLSDRHVPFLISSTAYTLERLSDAAKAESSPRWRCSFPIKDVVAVELKQTDGEDGLQLLSGLLVAMTLQSRTFVPVRWCPLTMHHAKLAPLPACGRGFQLNVLNGQCESWREREPLKPIPRRSAGWTLISVWPLTPQGH